MSIKLQLKSVVLAASFVFAALTASAADEYSFKIHNTTGSTIKKILVSEDGKEYGFFDVGKGIKPRQTVTLTWDASTQNESCKQFVKAVFDDGSESEPVKFDFCESELELEF